MAQLVGISGKPKTGKSISACTFPKPLLFMDWEGDGIISIDHAKDAAGKLIISPEERAQITHVDMSANGSFELNFKSVTKQKVTPAHAYEAKRLISLHNATLTELKTNPKGYKTLVIDPTTAMFRVWKDAILAENSQGDVQLQDYKTMEILLFRVFFPTLKALPLDYVVLVSHTETDRDELSGMLEEFPVGPSKSMGRNIGEVMHEIWYQEFTGVKAIWRTRPYMLFKAGSRHHVPDPSDANFSAVEKYLIKKEA